MAWKKERSRKFCLVLYPDCPEHCLALEQIKSSYDYAYILHDKDCDENGEIKKAHWHIVIITGSNARWNTALADELNIEQNRVETCKKLDRALQYLIHYNDPDKFQYEFNEVQGTLKTRLKIELSKDDKTEGEKVKELINYIKQNEGYISVTSFSEFCAINGYWDVFRRSGAIFIKMIDEHNKIFVDNGDWKNDIVQ